jgi:quercetin dioxygenase-like cupin family protein
LIVHRYEPGGDAIVKRCCQAAGLSILLAATSIHTTGAARAQQMTQVPPGISRTQLLDNDRVMVARLKLEPGAREPVHTHPFDAVVVQLTAGDVEMKVGGELGRGRMEPGRVWYIPRETPHSGANVGTAFFELVTVAVK